jgi:hypothetical protein
MAENTTLGLESAMSHDQLVIIKTFTIVTSIFGTAGNTLTILAILKGKLYQKSSFIFILNLSICNLIHCVILHPLLAIQAFHGIWTYRKWSCIAFAYGLFSNLGTELWGYTCITINRYICVVKHHLYARIYGDKRVVIGTLAVTWLFYPILFLFPLTGLWGNFVYAPRKLICYPFADYNCNGFCLFIYVIAISSTAPVILFCYGSIIHKYIKTQRKVGLGREKSSVKTSKNDLTIVKTDSERSRTLSELKMAFTILAVITVFAGCRMPFMILYLYDPSMSKVNPLIHTVLIYFGSCSNWINPIIYSFTNKTIFTSLKKLFTTWKKTFIVQTE